MEIEKSSRIPIKKHLKTYLSLIYLHPMGMKLMMELMNGNILKGWHEGAIKFAPTYKYCPNSDVYYGSCYQGKKTEKRRAPAW